MSWKLSYSQSCKKHIQSIHLPKELLSVLPNAVFYSGVVLHSLCVRRSYISSSKTECTAAFSLFDPKKYCIFKWLRQKEVCFPKCLKMRYFCKNNFSLWSQYFFCSGCKTHQLCHSCFSWRYESQDVKYFLK